MPFLKRKTANALFPVVLSTSVIIITARQKIVVIGTRLKRDGEYNSVKMFDESFIYSGSRTSHKLLLSLVESRVPGRKIFLERAGNL